VMRRRRIWLDMRRRDWSDYMTDISVGWCFSWRNWRDPSFRSMRDWICMWYRPCVADHWSIA
jgi:hypothetical protein